MRFMSIGMVAVCAAFSPCVGQSRPANDDKAGLERLDFRAVIQRAEDKVFPAVVFIKCLRESHEQGKKVSEDVSGSGVLISGAGEVLTNWHVVDKATEVRCLTTDGRPFEAKVVGIDKDTDLALLQLRIAADSPSLPYAVLGDSTRLKEGDFVMAMGAPWGLSRSVSIGIVSCTNRYLPENSEYSLWLQTDASISPGNSGGPLVNTDGEIVGINSRAVLFGGDMGFAIPSETIAHVVAQLREFGKVNWSWFGLQLQPLNDFKRNIYLEGNEGVVVAETDPDSPARHSGLKPRDRILKVNGESISARTEEDLPTLRRRLGLLPKHKAVKFDVARGNDRVVVELTPREKGRVEGEELDCPRWDFTAKTINQFDTPDLFFHRQQGVFVFGVKYPGNAATAGLQSQDIILKIDGKVVTTLQDVKAIHEAAMKNLDSRRKVLLNVLRNGLMRQVVLDYSRDHEKE